MESISIVFHNGDMIQMESVGLLKGSMDAVQYVLALVSTLMFRFRTASWPPSLWH